MSSWVIHGCTSATQPWECLITLNPDWIFPFFFFLKKPKALGLIIQTFGLMDNSPISIFISGLFRWEKGSYFAHISGGCLISFLNAFFCYFCSLNIFLLLPAYFWFIAMWGQQIRLSKWVCTCYNPLKKNKKDFKRKQIQVGFNFDTDWCWYFWPVLCCTDFKRYLSLIFSAVVINTW